MHVVPVATQSTVQSTTSFPRVAHQLGAPMSQPQTGSKKKRAPKRCAPCTKYDCPRRGVCNGKGGQAHCMCGHPPLAPGEKLAQAPTPSAATPDSGDVAYEHGGAMTLPLRQKAGRGRPACQHQHVGRAAKPTQYAALPNREPARRSEAHDVWITVATLASRTRSARREFAVAVCVRLEHSSRMEAALRCTERTTRKHEYAHVERRPTRAGHAPKHSDASRAYNVRREIAYAVRVRIEYGARVPYQLPREIPEQLRQKIAQSRSQSRSPGRYGAFEVVKISVHIRRSTDIVHKPLRPCSGSPSTAHLATWTPKYGQITSINVTQLSLGLDRLHQTASRRHPSAVRPTSA
ncbi:hypothetical protein DFH09DRAFT_1271452 [Mycena vulgaris]|nr:hypothetical protein DFH09DRAFT_1271452 [Mycena vulgaris]